MELIDGSITGVKSTSQRALALAWQRAARGSCFPCFNDFKPSDRSCDPKYMVIWTVEGGNNAPLFRAMYQGSFIETAFGENWVGKSMSEVIPIALRSLALAAASHSVKTGHAIYMNYAAPNASGGSINCERLLLPFGTRAQGVRQVVASMEPISFDGDVRLDRALADFVASFKITSAFQFSASSSELVS